MIKAEDVWNDVMRRPNVWSPIQEPPIYQKEIIRRALNQARQEQQERDIQAIVDYYGEEGFGDAKVKDELIEAIRQALIKE